MAKTPTTRVALTAEQEKARAAAKTAAAAVTAAQQALKALPADATAMQQAAAQLALTEAKNAATIAQAAAQAAFQPTTAPPAQKPAQARSADTADQVELVPAVAMCVVRWSGKFFEPGQSLEPHPPRPVFDELELAGAVTPAA